MSADQVQAAAPSGAGGDHERSAARPEAAAGTWTERQLRAGVTGLMVVAAVVRLIGITRPPFGFHATRQLYDAEMARAFWVRLGGSVPEGWHHAVLAAQGGVIEPPVVQGLAAVLYRLGGGEHLTVIRVVLALAWVAAAPAVWGLGRRLAGSTAGLVATAVWCLAPYGVAASRSFQPDGLMVALITATVWAVVRDDDDRTAASRWLAVALGAAAVFVKLVAGFFVVPLLVYFAFRRRRAGERSLRRPVIDLVVVVGPAVLFLVVGMATGLLAGQEGGRIFPELLVDAGFWSDWAAMSIRSGGALFVVVTVIALVWSRGRARGTLGVLVVGYALFGLFFTYHYGSHDYYHLPLVVVVALGSGLFVERMRAKLAADGAHPGLVAGVVVLVLLAGLVTTRSGYPYVESWEPAGWAARIRQAEEIGEALDHSTGVVFLAPVYGAVERYEGGLAGPAWPNSSDVALRRLDGRAPLGPAEQLARMVDDQDLKWFLVADPGLLDDDPELAGLLEATYPVGARGEGWWAYRLDQPFDQG